MQRKTAKIDFVVNMLLHSLKVYGPRVKYILKMCFFHAPFIRFFHVISLAKQCLSNIYTNCFVKDRYCFCLPVLCILLVLNDCSSFFCRNSKLRTGQKKSMGVSLKVTHTLY